MNDILQSMSDEKYMEFARYVVFNSNERGYGRSYDQ